MIGELVQTRVRNSLIDVVAGTDHFKPDASSLQNDFVVEGEQHYWVHPPPSSFGVAGIAIDRFEGTIVGQQLEEVVGLVSRLADLFPNSGHVHECGLDAGVDNAIWKFAAREDFTIVSKDWDFHDQALFTDWQTKSDLAARGRRCRGEIVATKYASQLLNIECAGRSPQRTKRSEAGTSANRASLGLPHR